MRFSRIAIAIALSGFLFPGTSRANDQRQTYPVKRTEYSDYYSYSSATYQTSPSDAPVPAAPAPTAAASGSCAMPSGCGAPLNHSNACGCNSGCVAGSYDSCVSVDGEEGEECERWYLFPEIGCGWRLHGFINAGGVANADSPATHFNGPVSFNDRERITLNQLYGIFERPVDTGGDGFGWGARVDMLFGTDYIFTQATGLETHLNGAPKWNRRNLNGAGNGFADYGLAMPQAYGEFGLNDLNVKVGHFYAPVGYQVVPANGNFFISQPYTFQYGEPFTFTGAMGTWKWSDETTLIGGAINGWDKFDARTNKLGVFGGFTHAPSHGEYIVNHVVVIGEEDGTNLPIVGTRWLSSFVFTYNMSENWQYIFQNDVGIQQDAIAVGTDAEWYGINQYLFYKVNDCWKLGLRAEWFRDDDGVRLANFPIRQNGFNNFAGAQVPVANLAGHYYEFAPGLNWTPTKNLTVRSELRWDWSGGNVVAPFNDRQKDSQFLAAFDAILLW